MQVRKADIERLQISGFWIGSSGPKLGIRLIIYNLSLQPLSGRSPGWLCCRTVSRNLSFVASGGIIGHAKIWSWVVSPSTRRVRGWTPYGRKEFSYGDCRGARGSAFKCLLIS